MRKSALFSNLVFSFHLVLCNVNETQVLDEELVLKNEQKLLFDEFKERVLPILPTEYRYKEDIFLIKWLRAKSFDMHAAEEFLKKNLKWREENQIDKIHEEKIQVPGCSGCIYFDVVDKKGSPVITAVSELLDLRGSQSRNWKRLLLQAMEVASMKVREARNNGTNVSRFHFLLDLGGFSLSKHACPRCLTGILDFIRNYENHYPGMMDKLVLFNAPQAVQAVRPVVRGALSGRTRGQVTLIGQNKKEWQEYLLKFIDASQLPEEFGGTRVRTLHA